MFRIIVGKKFPVDIFHYTEKFWAINKVFGVNEMKPTVSVVLSIRNEAKTIGACLSSILAQTFSDFEIIIVDDLSTDSTQKIIQSFKDQRILYFLNERWLGLSGGRNKSWRLATGSYIFFTDGDCCVDKNWIKEGLTAFKSDDVVGVEGKTYYVSEDYRPSRSDAVVENLKGGQFMTCNIAYRRAVLERIGGFDERFTYLEDRDLSFRVIKFGRITFSSKMLVYHQKKILTVKQFMQSSQRLKNRVFLYKRFGDKVPSMWKFVYPLDLAKLIFPPLVFGSLIRNKYNRREDFVLFPFIYCRLLLERISFWGECARERVFLI
jgi:glycosyltransferase involved in cell wall biosynthesis